MASPKFADLYNESLLAEMNGLTSICGMGYRKALEFLVKDFLISRAPDKEAEIGKKPLSQCIKSIDNEKIRIVASRCAWLGNDQAHYKKKFEEFGLPDLKKLIDAVAYWISVEIITDSAPGIEPRR